MNLIIIRDKLKEGLAMVSRAIGAEQKLPILKNVLLTVGDNKATLVATNLEVAITYGILGKVIAGGKITVPAGILTNIIQNIQSERLSLEVKKTILEVRTDNYEAKIQGLGAEDFPIIPKISNDDFIEIDGGVLKEALNQTLIATQFSELRA